MAAAKRALKSSERKIAAASAYHQQHNGSNGSASSMA